ncbi:helix-turn-helix transcriptional regulator [Labrenzia sp. CE80]|uniref:helix-turn-helix transcriptional regulator n=1 Tax=Labrenzia sp. CE80 TaxID=1788986 RepID=UPI00129B3D6B|nr:helix-turn-helix transcriptional regulator [Labrenzia sp. CE80]
MHLPNSAEKLLGETISALGTNQFQSSLFQWLNRCFQIDNTTMLAYFQDRQPEVLFAQTVVKRVHEKLDTDYVSGVYLLDPFHALHVDQAPPGLYRLKDIAPDQFQRNEYFASYYQRTTLIDEIAYVAYPSDGVSVHICLGRDSSSGRRYSSRDLLLAGRLSPIVCSLVQQQWSELQSGGVYSEADLTSSLIRSGEAELGVKLSPRQAEVALLIMRGHSSASIGLKLGISFQTVKVIRKQLYRKCNISSQAELFSCFMPLLAGVSS